MVSVYLILRKERLIIGADERSQALTSDTMLVAKSGYVKALNLPHPPPTEVRDPYVDNHLYNVGRRVTVSIRHLRKLCKVIQFYLSDMAEAVESTSPILPGLVNSYIV